jgi:hypothetical protein
MPGGDLEYLMSSLPYLSFDHSGESQRRVSDCFKKYAGAQFADLPLVNLLEREAAKFLSPDRYRQFKEIRLDQIHQNTYLKASLPLLSGFAGYVASLRQELKEIRLARREATDPLALEKIALPFKPGNPLEEEIRVLQLQWDKLEALSAMHYADFSALVAYKLKLMLLVRLWSFDEQKGFEIFVESTNALS